MHRPIVLAVCLIAFWTVLAYLNSFSGTFIQDDYETLLNGWDLSLYFKPVNVFTDQLNTRGFTMFTFAVNRTLFGSAAFSYHIGSLTIHLLASLMVFDVVRQTLTLYRSRGDREASEPFAEQISRGDFFIALATALIFAVHPLQSQAVTYLSQRSESLMGLMYLASLAAMIRGFHSTNSLTRPGWLLLSIVCCALGMRAKEAMVVAPLLITWYSLVFLPVGSRAAFLKRVPYYALLWATISLNSSFAQIRPVLPEALGESSEEREVEADSSNEETNSQEAFSQKGARLSRWEYFKTQPGIILTYVRLVFWPNDLCFDMGHVQPPADWVFWSSAAILSLAFLATVIAVFVAPAWGFLGVWFFINLGPRSSFIPLENPYFEYRMYLPILSILVLCVIGFDRMIRRLQWDVQTKTGVRILVTAVVVVVLTGLTYRRNTLYANPTLLWRDTVENAPWNGRAYTNLTRGLLLEGSAEALEDAVKFGEQAVALSPSSAKAANMYGLALHRTGNIEEAKEQYLRATRLDSELMHPWLNLGNIYSPTDSETALAYYARARQLAPNDPAVVTNYASTMLYRGEQTSTAIQMLEQLAAGRPDHIDSRYNLAFYLVREGQYREARPLVEELLRLSPGDQRFRDLQDSIEQNSAGR
ncbi:tetratricopeptide repeat protein [Rubinisphaera margarita]|uniref:tetratricopeptide repeat protein n=1 Tax=Rubinisphaera margarita TaxID=2909586 RepID=UPI001EE98DB6|nr:tetratricopeptide repeat protein [Rubinisphaera margarita]MCG6158606.1 tetratricopeptide repeat protein [Rubinisphaera margarita]